MSHYPSSHSRGYYSSSNERGDSGDNISPYFAGNHDSLKTATAAMDNHSSSVIQDSLFENENERVCRQCTHVLPPKDRDTTHCPMCGVSLRNEALFDDDDDPRYREEDTAERKHYSKDRTRYDDRSYRSDNGNDFYPQETNRHDGRDERRNHRTSSSYLREPDHYSHDEDRNHSRYRSDRRDHHVSYDQDPDHHAPRFHDREDDSRYYRDEKRKRTDYYDDSRRRYHHDEEDSYRDRSRRDEKRPTTYKKEREWPPSFESCGASYVFDNRSGLFYEPSTNFFYDPKTKLYFGNKQQKYYHFVPESNPPFQEVVANSTTAGLVVGGEINVDMNKTIVPFSQYPSQDAVADDLIIKALGGGPSAIGNNPDSTVAGGKKKKIAISLKKANESTVPSDSTTLGETMNTSPKESIEVERMNVKETECGTDVEGFIVSSKVMLKRHEADIDKWSQRGREMNTQPSTGLVETADTKQVKLTVSGQPICMICKRKFSSMEKLQQHEQFSDLHKQNLANISSNDHSAAMNENEGEAMQYRDRALERRILYPDSHVIAASLHVKGTAHEIKKPIEPSQILNEEHIGNKMLQKLGWAGGSLGKTQDESNICQSEDSSKKTVSAKLREDWERIESLASKQSS